MAIKIKLKNSVTQDAVPTGTHLPEVGELAVNANINSIGGYMRASDNSIVKIFGPGSVSTPAASTTVSGIAELATSAETTTGTDTARVCTPAGVKAVTDAERTTSNSTYLALSGGTLAGVLQATAGSNSAASIHFGDTDSGLFGGTNTVSLTAGGTTRLTADTGVSVVGTLAVTGAITSTSDLTIPDKIIHAGDSNTSIRFPAADTVSIETAGSEVLQVDSSGRLLIGMSSAIDIANNSFSHLQMAWTDKSASMGISRFSANTSPPSFNFGKARGGTVGTMTIVQQDDDLGEINFCGADGADLGNVSARIRVAVDDAPAVDDIPGRIEFYTFKASTNTLSEALRITNDGIVRVPDNGKFTAGGSNDLSIFHDADSSYIEHTTSGTDLVIDAKSPGDDLILRAADDVNIRVQGNEDAIKCIGGGAVTIYNGNSPKFATSSTGVTVTGALTTTDKIHCNSSNSGKYLRVYAASGTGRWDIYGNGANLRFSDNDSAGHIHFDTNVGIGIVPSAWATNGDFKALQVGTGFAAFGRGSGDEDRGGIAVNYYHDGTNEKYIANGHANRIYMNDGNIDFQYAASASAGNNLSFTSGIRMLADGKVGIGTTSPTRNLDVTASNGVGIAHFTNTASSFSNGCYTVMVDSSAHTSNMTLGGAFAVDVNSGRAMTINGLGNCGMGTASPDQKLHIYESATDGQCYLHLQNNRSRNCGVQFETTQGSWYVGQGIGSDTDTFMIYDDQARFSVNSNGSIAAGTVGGTYSLELENKIGGADVIMSMVNSTANEDCGIRITGTHTGVGTRTSKIGHTIVTSGTGLQVHSPDNIVLYTGSTATERLRIDDNGIKFRGDTGVDNALNDYEYGVFTPNITNGLAGTPTYLTRSGHYVKIGNKVHLDFYIRIDDADANGAHYYVGDFPFNLKGVNYVRGGGTSTYFSLNCGAGGDVTKVVAFYGKADNNAAELYQGNISVKGTNGVANDGLYVIGFFEYITDEY